MLAHYGIFKAIATWRFLTPLYHETCDHIISPKAPLHNMAPSATVTNKLYMMEDPIRNDNPRPRRRSIHTAIYRHVQPEELYGLHCGWVSVLVRGFLG